MEQLFPDYSDQKMIFRNLKKRNEVENSQIGHEDDDTKRNAIASFFKNFQNMLQTKNEYGEISRKFEELEKAALSIARGDYSQKIDLPGTRTLFARIGILINRMAELSREHMVSRHMFDSVLECVTDSAVLLTDPQGRILYLNQETSRYFKRAKKDIVNLNIATVFTSLKQFAGDNMPAGDTLFLNEWLRPYNTEPFRVEVFIRELRNSLDKADGYLYVLKKVEMDNED